MNTIWVIATNTFRQVVRQRLFYNLLVFGLGMLILSVLVGSLTIGYPSRVVRSIGLSGVSVVLDLVALLVGVALIHQEIDRKTLFVVLTRPLQRWQYVLGRYFGLLGVLAAALLGLSAIFLFCLVSMRGDPTAVDVMALLMSLVEAAVLGAAAVVLSSFSTPTLSAGIGIGFWIICATTDDLVRLAQSSGEAAVNAAKVLSYALPSFARFNLREIAVYAQPLPVADVVGAAAYGFLYAAFLMAIASVILSKREMV